MINLDKTHFSSAYKYGSKEQCQKMAVLSNQIQAWERMVYGPADPYTCKPEGIVHVVPWLDMSGPKMRVNTMVLIDAGYQRSFRYMMNGIKQDGLLGKYEAAIELQKRVI